MKSSREGLIASIHERLLNISKDRGEQHQFLLMEYARERLLYRISISRFSNAFILKGATSLFVRTGQRYRATRDIDLLGFGECTIESMRATFSEIIAIEYEADGLRFEALTMKAAPIREDALYEGIELDFVAFLGKARIPVHVDVGFGDAVVPEPELVRFPVLLGMPAPVVRAYPIVTSIAEKLEAMISLGKTNSRMKDYHDILSLSRLLEFDGSVFVHAIRSTFERRGTQIPLGLPFGLTDDFADDPSKQKQWRRYCERTALNLGDNLHAIVFSIREFCVQPLKAARAREEFLRTWQPGAGWN